MKPVYGEQPIVGYSSSIEELRVDYEMYELFYMANAQGATMTSEQLARRDELRRLFG
jgi:hypothetical protein